jgi:putative hydrolase of the HAD superfamily
MKDDSIDTITFDLWNTLIAHDDEYDENIRRIRVRSIKDTLDEKGLCYSHEELKKAHDVSGEVFFKKWSCDIDVCVEEQLETFLKCLGVEPTNELICSIDAPYTEAVLKVEPFIVDGALDVVKGLKEKGYRIALISNTGRTPGKSMRKVMNRMGMLDLFEATVFSNEVGFQKPNTKIFETALGMIGSKPSRSVHIGDHSVLDVLGAKRMGMKSVQVTKYAKKEDRKHSPDIMIEDIKELPDAIYRLKYKA